MAQISQGQGGAKVALPPSPKSVAVGPGDQPGLRGDYGGATADAFKATPAYHQAVVQVFRAQPPAQQRAIVTGALRNPTPEGKMVLSDVFKSSQGMLQTQRAQRIYGPKLLSAVWQHNIKGPSVFTEAANTLSSGLGDIAGGLDALRQSTSVGGNPQAMGIGGGDVGKLVYHVPIDIARAALEKPSTIPTTIKGLGEQALAAGAGLVELPIRMGQIGVGPALSQLGKGIARDYSQRYGPLIAGNDRAFIDRLKQQGAGPELLDTIGALGGFDATLGRGAVGLAKLRETLTGESNFLTRARPALRISGNELRDQSLAKGALKVSMQRAEDRLRSIIHAPERPGEVAPLFQGRGQRVLVSGVQAAYRRNMQDALNHEVRGRSGIQGDFRKLSPWEKKAATIAHEGWIPLRSGPEAAVKALEARRQQILADRANPESLGNKIAPKDAATVDDVKLIEQLQANTSKWLTPKLAAFIDKQGERAARIERGDERGLTQSATARRLRPQGEMLGIEHPDAIAERAQAGTEVAGRGASKSLLSFGQDLRRTHAMGRSGSLADKFANYEETRPGLLQDYIDRIRAERPKEWPEPSYMEHTMRPKENFGAFTQGSGHKAMPSYKQSRFDLWRGGAIYRHPQMMVDSVAKGIKGHYQWPMVDELWRRNGLPAPPAAAIKAALGHSKSSSELTGYELARAYDHMGIDLRNYRFGNPGRLSEHTLADLGYAKRNTVPIKIGKKQIGERGVGDFASRAGYMPPEFGTDSNLAAAMHSPEVTMDGRAVHDSLHNGRPLDSNNPFVKSYGWKAVPTAAYDEIHSGLRPSGLAARSVGKGMGLTAGLILGGSPSFVVMNTLAHALLTAFATRGRILTDALKAPVWYHGLSDEERAIVDAQARGRGHYAVQKLGSTTPGALRDSWRKFQQSLPGRGLGQINPVAALWKLEDKQSNFFRRVSYYSVTKQMAFENVGKELGLAQQAMSRFMHSFDVGPKDQMAAILHNQPWAEEAGRRVVNALGDYARFTHRERSFGRGVLFYSFLRHVMRNLFYVLPLKHPIALALVGELGQLHKQEVQKILGPNPAAWTYGRVFFDHNGKLTSIDFTRALPVGGTPTEVASQGVKGLASMVPPAAQPLLDMIYGQTASGQKVPANFWTFANELGSLSYPYRFTKDLAFGTQLQNPDSVPFLHPSPETRKSAAGQAYLQAKEQALGPLHDLILGSLLGLYPKPDDSRVIAQHAAAKKAGGSGGGNLPAGSGAADLLPASSGPADLLPGG
jgi:hypothetical protein